MNTNTSIVTDTTEQATEHVVDGYQASIMAHINGDFGQHTCVKVYNVPFVESVTGHTVSSKSMRILLNHPTYGQMAVIVPCEETGTSVIIGSAPIILKNPEDQSVAANGNAQFSVIAASQTPPTYQWSKDGTNLSGQIASTLLLTSIDTLDAGVYGVVVSNAYGSIVSSNGTLTVI